MQTISIVSSKDQSRYLAQLHSWFVAEWGDIDTFEGTDEGFIIPPPIVAISAEGLVGGLSFSSFAIPTGKELGLWINALLVAPDYRGMGVASRLIKAAESEASRIEAKTLFAYTNVSRLYQNLDWGIAQSNGNMKVMERVVGK